MAKLEGVDLDVRTKANSVTYSRKVASRVVNVNETKEVCLGRPKWRSVVSAYPALGGL